MKDYFNYKNKICVITGAASGIGKELIKMLKKEGAIVYALDFRQVEDEVNFIKVNLAHKDEIDNALKQIPGSIDKLFSNAATPGIFYGEDRFTVEEVFAANYGAPRYIIENLSKRMHRGASITVTASCVGYEWRKRVSLYGELFEKYSKFEDCKKWAERYIGTLGEGDALFPQQYVYGVSKEALIYYAKRISFDLQVKGIRLNLSAPGAVDTKMTPDFGIISRYFGEEDFDDNNAAVNPAVGRAATAYEQALVLLFLGSDMSAALSGADIESDFGFTNSMYFGRCDINGKLLEV